MCHLPRQAFIVVPSVASFQVPFVPQREIDEWTVEQVRKVFNGPVVEDNNHLLVLSDTLSNTGNVGPQPVARLSWGVTDYSH